MCYARFQQRAAGNWTIQGANQAKQFCLPNEYLIGTAYSASIVAEAR